MNSKVIRRVVAGLLALAIVLPMLLCATIAGAATVGLSSTKKNVSVGDSFTLKVTGTKSKVTWSSSEMQVATVTQKGKVVTKAPGVTTIIAKVNKKKYTCEVTVTKPSTEYVVNAAYNAKVATFGNYTMVIPTGWAKSKNKIASQDKKASVTVTITKDSKATQTNADSLISKLKKSTTKGYVRGVINDASLKVESVDCFDCTLDWGKSLSTLVTTQYEIDGITHNKSHVIYDVFADGYHTQIVMTDDDSENENPWDVAYCMANSMVYKK